MKESQEKGVDLAGVNSVPGAGCRLGRRRIRSRVRIRRLPSSQLTTYLLVPQKHMKKKRVYLGCSVPAIAAVNYHRASLRLQHKNHIQGLSYVTRFVNSRFSAEQNCWTENCFLRNGYLKDHKQWWLSVDYPDHIDTDRLFSLLLIRIRLFTFIRIRILTVSKR